MRAMAFQNQSTSRSGVMTKVKKCNYAGPYDRTALEKARQALAQIVSDRDSTIWERIKIKSGVYHNKRDVNPGWGEASTRYSHAGLPEYLNNMELYCQYQNNNVTTLLSSSVKKTSGSRPSQSTATETSDMSMTVTVTRDLVIQPVDDNIEQTKLNRIYTDVARVVQVNDQRKFSREKDEDINRQTLQRVEILDKMTVPQEISIHADLYEPNLISDGLEIVRVQTNNKSAVKCGEVAERKNNKTVNDVTSRHVKSVDAILDQSNEFVFKCDFCDLQYVDDDEMYKHLKNSVHFSASTYECSSDSSRLILKQTMSVVNDVAMYKTILAICPFPKCNRISSNIHDCATHYYRCHGKRRNMGYKYGLVEVVLEETVENPIFPLICKSCGSVFEKRSKLNMHYKKNIGHYPYDTMHGNPVLYFCSCCFDVFPSFADITAHQALVHAREVVSGILHFTAFHYTQITTKPYEGKEEENTSERNTENIKRKMLDNDIYLLDEPQPKVIIRASNNGQTNATLASKIGVSTIDISNLTENSISDDSYPHFFIDRTPSDKINNVSISHSLNNNADAAINIKDDGDVDDDEQKCLDISSLRQIYKCDYCSTISENKLRMLEHLKVKNHRSASTVFVDCKSRVVYLKQSCSLMGNLEGIVSIVAACPDYNCPLLFSNIYKCSEHYTMTHNRLSAATYGLASVQHSMLLSYNLYEYKCQLCGLECLKARELNSHMKKNDHFPYVDREDCLTCFFCLFCEKSFKSYAWITAHLFSKHKKLSGDGTLDLMVLFVSQSKVTKRHPPYPPGKHGEIRSIKHKIVCLKELKKTATKKGKKPIRKEIQNLKRLL